MIRVRRAYSPPAADADLRRCFGHDPDRWDEFRDRYFSELDRKSEALEPIRQAARLGNVTLLYGARDTEHNNAVALRAYLEEL
jgi:uncharacterized protein YeaO (DUF488 family)